MWFSYFLLFWSSVSCLFAVSVAALWSTVFLFLVWSSLLYLFASGCARLHCGAGFPLAVACRGCSQACCSHCVGSCCGAQNLRHAGFRSLGPWLCDRGSQALEHELRNCTVCGLSCSMACGILLATESNSRPLHWQADSLVLSHQESRCSPLLPVFLWLVVLLVVMNRTLP